jgi:hypothetical protein
LEEKADNNVLQTYNVQPALSEPSISCTEANSPIEDLLEDLSFESSFQERSRESLAEESNRGVSGAKKVKASEVSLIPLSEI